MKLTDLTDIVKDLNVINDSEFDILGMVTTKYTNKKVLSFLSDSKILKCIIENPNIKALILKKEIYENTNFPKNVGIILSNDPKSTFYEIHNKLSEMDFYWEKFENKIEESVIIAKSASIGEHSISIGRNTIIEANVVIHPGTMIGSNVIIRSGSQVGTSGFQFMNDGKNVTSVRTAGRVIVMDNVEIQHNCCVDRGVFGGNTVLNEYVKIDNFVHIGHDDVIGARTFITAGVKLSGRVTIGKDCWIGVNATVSNGIEIGDNSKISLGSVVTKNVDSNMTVSGNFAIEHRKFIDFIKSIR